MNASMEQKGEQVVVAVRASKHIRRDALVWALTHVVHPGDCMLLLVVLPRHTPGKKLWGFPRFSGDCASSHGRPRSGDALQQTSNITESCSQMMLQLHGVYDSNKINVEIKIVSGSPSGAVAAESKRALANWVILDKCLKHEKKRCLEDLQCNIAAMKRSQAKVLRLNLGGSPEAKPRVPRPSSPEIEKSSDITSKHSTDSLDSVGGPTVTPSSSPEFEAPFTATEAGASSVSSSDPGTLPYFISVTTKGIKKEELKTSSENRNLDVTSSKFDSESISPSTTLDAEILSAGRPSSEQVEEISQSISTATALLSKYTELDEETGISNLINRSGLDFGGGVREAISLSLNAPSGRPLCSRCQHMAPVLGKQPRQFSYAELELATDGFSQANFLAEGGYGSVHRGVLPDDQRVAVKQHKLATTQGDRQFCSEVEVLRCAQHRNVVMLIGYCVEDMRRLLVYEYICNGSLHSHLYGRNQEPLEWSARQKIAVGTARGLRHLHEDCRVGCIVHRDLRPCNILITHDFEPLVGDFGLARWQPDGNLGVETRLIGSFGYMAPEYAQSSQITEKTDVYSFGVVLVELVTGRKAMDANRPEGERFLAEWARRSLKEYPIDELVDPRLGNRYSEHEVYRMLHAASLCVRRNPHDRPQMSRVLRILEGDIVMERKHLATPAFDHGKTSRRKRPDQQTHQQRSEPILHEAFESSVRKNSYGVSREAAYRERQGKAGLV